MLKNFVSLQINDKGPAAKKTCSLWQSSHSKCKNIMKAKEMVYFQILNNEQTIDAKK